ncbi:unnamed protein product [Lactuca virosa]|uniref:Uncharacterized protein n=1 Tax=Lactuca virosa TaxID=75947 RepID=A0AAU9NZR2_9ASTR|nr:unnamed protein product [Lactuca virosa]
MTLAGENTRPVMTKTTIKKLKGLHIHQSEEKKHSTVEGIDLSTVNECEEENEIIVQWKQQHLEVTKSQQTLCELIEASEVADEMFVLNFITLFVNTMIEKKSCGGLQPSITMKIGRIKNWENINWCKYLSDALPHSMTSWKPRNKGVYYAGPLPFLLLLYLHSTDCQNQYVNRKIRPICYWNYGKIKSRQNIEKAQGQLGLVTLVQDNDLIQYKDEEDVDFVKEKGKGKQVEKDADTEENDDIGAENYCLLIESEFENILECRNRIQKTLQHALQKYPDDRELCGWFERFVNIEKVFNKSIGESSRTREKENENETGEKEFEHHLETQKGEENATKETKYDSPNFEDNMSNTPNMEAEQKDFLTNESQGEGTTNNKEEKGNEKNILEEKNDQGEGKEKQVYKRSKRTPTKIESYQSPYMRRTFEVRRKLEAVETRISKSIFSLQKDHNVHLTDNEKTTREIVHTYEMLPYYLFNFMISYLIDKKHPKADDLMKKEVVIFKLKWWIENNKNDNVVMLMRHMETFKGQGQNNWDSEIEKDQKQQKTQLTKLRSKYVTKILVNDINIHNNKIIEDGLEFEKLTTEEQKQVVNHGMQNYEERFQLIGEN